MESTNASSAPNGNASPPAKKKETGFYEPYSDYHRSLRLWFLAYGIGVPVFLVQYPGAVDSLKACGVLLWVIGLILVGVALQIVIAMLYKTAMWYLYMEEIGEVTKPSWLLDASEWLSTAYWLEFLFDVVTLVVFAVGTWLILGAVTR